MKTLTDAQQKLLEEYIVIEFENDEYTFKITKRENFIKTKTCETYDGYGQMCGCFNAGCYALDNSDSTIHTDLLLSIESKFEVKLHKYFADMYGTNFENIAELIQLVDELNNSSDDEKTSYQYTDIDTDALKEFSENWIKENEQHTECLAWTFHDSHNFKSIVIETYEGQPTDAKEADVEISLAILEEYPGQLNFNEPQIGIKTDKFEFKETKWSNDPWLAHVVIL